MRGLIDLFEMPNENLIKMGCNGYKLVQSTFSWKLIASQMEQLYNWTLDKCERPGFVYLD